MLFCSARIHQKFTSCERGPIRNYFKVRGLNWQYEIPPTPPPFGELFAFGKDDQQLFEVVQQINATQRISFPTIIFHYPRAPIFVYWELNAENFSRLLNQAPLQFWGNTNLPTNFPQQGLFTDMTKTEVEGSPRATFPTSEGTDGQRLRAAKRSQAGNALNYIARLFFLTSNEAFLSIWNQLKAHRITPKKALQEANALAMP